MNILILGKNGQLGHELDLCLSNDTRFTVLSVARDQVDVTDQASIEQCLTTFRPDIIFNATAYTAVDKAESEPDTAMAINADSLTSLVNAADKLSEQNDTAKPWIVHFSTDYVFDGESKIPYTETDVTSPMGVYGKTKHQGEVNLLAHYDNAIIFRISWVYSYRANNFVKTMLRLGAEKETINVVDDQFGCPNYAPDLATAMIKVVDKIANKESTSGVYHLTSTESTSWYAFAKAIMHSENLPCVVNPIPSSEYPTPAKRPQYSVMSANKLANDFGITVAAWPDALARCLDSIKRG